MNFRSDRGKLQFCRPVIDIEPTRSYICFERFGGYLVSLIFDDKMSHAMFPYKYLPVETKPYEPDATEVLDLLAYVESELEGPVHSGSALLIEVREAIAKQWL